MLARVLATLLQGGVKSPAIRTLVVLLLQAARQKCDGLESLAALRSPGVSLARYLAAAAVS